MYFKNQRILYEGEFQKGMFEGYGRIFYFNLIKYEGQWNKNCMFGLGKFTNEKGHITEGQF